MKDLLLQLITVSYASVGLIGIAAYLPTIKDLHIHKKASANISSYRLWTITTFISFLYSSFILSDLLFSIVSGMNFVFCSSILILTIRLKNCKLSTVN